MGVENQAGTTRKAENEQILNEGSQPRKNIKRKLTPDCKKDVLSSKEEKEQESDSYFDGNLEFLGTIANEDDTTDDEQDNYESELDGDESDADSIIKEVFGSEHESEELSFVEDSGEESESVNDSLEKSNNISLNELENNKIEKLRKSFGAITSVRERGKGIKTNNKKNIGAERKIKFLETDTKRRNAKNIGRFVKPNPENVVCGQTEDEDEDEEKEEEEKVEEEEEEEDGEEESTKDEKGSTDDKKIITDNLVELLIPRKIVLDKKKVYDEYEIDTSDEEDIRNTVGNVPLNWYDEYPHLGYDWKGNKIIKPPQGDEIDNFLKKMEDPNFWRTVKDPQTGQDVVLCDADVELITRIQKRKIPDPDFQEYSPWIEWFSSQVMKTPLRNFPEHKRSFLPSKDEARQVSRIVYGIKMGWIKPKAEKPVEKQKYYMLWETDDQAEHMRRVHNHIPAPKRNLPNHAESYNPPPEYLFDKREMSQWLKLKNTPWLRKVHFVPQKYSSLRQVPYYHRYIKERFMRCMDLYMCPRAWKMRLLIQPEDLVPQLPSPKDLQPFPTTLALVYNGHTDMVRCITVEPKGQYLASGSDDMTVKIWEVVTGRCVHTIPAGGIVRSISWCPNPSLALLAVAADRKLFVINANVGDILVVKKTDALLQEAPEQDVLVSEKVKAVVQWEQAVGEQWKKGIRIIINHFKEIKQVTWHGRADYFASVMCDGQNRAVVIHQLSKRRSQFPFNKSKGLVQCVLFHPIRPLFFVATQKHVRIYDLVKQEMMKKLFSNAKWISNMAIHSGGDNLLVGTYDRKILWFDLDLSTKPYKILRLHGCAIRGVAFHKRYPLFASGSDDNSVIVSHGMVYNDLLKNPLVVPVKRMSYHEKVNDFSVFEVVFHPFQPWLFSSGADGTVRLYT